MLFSSYELLLSDPASFLRLTTVVCFALLVAVTIHEFSHALIANGLGDGTARRLGRLSLNPLRHLDAGGTLMLLVVGFGWGKPVPVDHHRLSGGRLGMTLVALAGPLSNLVVAFLVAIPIKAGLLGVSALALGRSNLIMTGGLREGLTDIAMMVILFNLLLGVFNLIPVFPLDGSRVVGGLVPARWAEKYAYAERWGPVVLIAVVLVDIVFGLGILWSIIGPPVMALMRAATGF
jgi:Zn-dependent protease